jgi:glyoxylase-like metal-dependent hydrolase (beta-lactamase superfamily II)
MSAHLSLFAPGVWIWSFYSKRLGRFANGWYFEHADGGVVVDPVDAPESVYRDLTKRGVSRIVLTCAGHMRASGKLRAYSKAPVAVHALDAAQARAQGALVDQTLSPGEVIGPLEIITAPGRSPGGVACLDAAHGRLVVGDLCVGLDPGRCGPPDGLPEENRAAWRATVSTRAARGDVDALLHGDGVPSPTGGRAALRALATTR